MSLGIKILLKPAGLRVLARTEALERFAFCGTQLLLLLYLTQILTSQGGEARIFGMAALRHGLMAVVGDVDRIGFATQFVAIFAAVVHLAPIGGAWIARRIGRRVTVAAGGLIMAMGHLLLGLEAWLLPGLFLLAIGAGCSLSNKLSQVGTLFDAADRDRIQGFATFAIATNFGALMAPIVCGTLGESGLWHWGFRAAGIAMLIGLANYIAGWHHLPEDDEPVSSNDDGRRIAIGNGKSALMLVCLLPYILAIVVLNQAYMLAILWASTHVARTVAGFIIPITWVLVVDGAMSIIGIALAVEIWRRFDRRNPIGEMHKLAIGCLILVGAYLFLAGSASLPTTPLALFLVFFFLLDVGAAWLDPPMEAFLSRHAMAGRRDIVMAIFKASSAVAALVLGWLGRYYLTLGPARFWLMNAGLAAVAALLAILLALAVVRAERRSSR